MLLLRTDLLLTRANVPGQKTTPSSIAQRIGVRSSTMGRLIAGRTTPSLSTLVALRAAYGISLDDLVLEATKNEAACPSRATPSGPARRRLS